MSRFVMNTTVIGCVLACMTMVAQANVFLGRSPEQVPSEEFSLDAQHALLGELENVLGGSHKSFTTRRLAKIEDALRPIFAALQKNEHGNLCHAGASYALHRVFVQRHGWSVKGLQSETKAVAAWNNSSPMKLFAAGNVSNDVTGAFEQRIAKVGLGLHDLAVLAATLEHLVHMEAMQRLRLSYNAHKMTAEDVVSTGEAENIMDSYMVLYLLGFMLKNPNAATPMEVQKLRKIAPEVYPGWNGTQEFMREVMESVATKRDDFYFSDVATVIEEAGERYGSFQDKECRMLKDDLMAIEDKSPTGAGRVRLTDFYKLAVHEGMVQFSESVNFLRQQGALDESDPLNPRVLITNYIASPSNCVASSSFFSVCCTDECEGLFQQLEKSIAAPDATPDVILSAISSLASQTMAKNRVLSSWLQERLQSIATHHGGRVPLHGRLFTQWMHFAYPRECSYPHVSGAMEGQRPEDVFSQEALQTLDSAFTEQQMLEHIEAYSNRTEKADTINDEFDMWSMEEELVVSRPIQPTPQKASVVTSIARSAAFVAMIFSTMSIFWKIAPKSKSSGSVSEKYYV